MIGLFVVAAAGAAALMSHQPAAEAPADPLIGALVQTVRDQGAADLYAKVRAEQRGPSVVRTEQQIETRLMALPLVGKGGNVLRVTCGSTICEIAGTLPGRLAAFGPTKNGLPPTPPLPGTSTPAYLAKLGLRKGDLEKLGLRNETGDFIQWQGQTKPFLFLLYYSRQDGAAK